MSINAALKYLLALIASGWEYPDAHTKTVLRFRCNGDELTAAYDAAGGAA